MTAQRVQKNLQKTPVAVTSFNAEVLKERGITNILDLNALAPNVSIGTRSGQGPQGGAITIRGIGVDANPPASPSVGIYIDDVYFPGAFGNLLGLFDVGRVEIDRGPQGTLFGRNTIAGAIQYITVQPQLGKYGGFVEDTVGNLNREDINAGVNIPIGNIAALRVSGGINDRNGYVHDQLNDDDRGADRTEEGRAQLLIKPDADLTITLKGEFVDDRSNGAPTIPIAFDYNDPLGAPYAPNGLNQYLSPNDYALRGLDGTDYGKTQFRIVQGVVTYRLTDDLTLKSITAASANESNVQVDEDRTPVLLLDVNRGDVNDRLFTQELQLSGTAINDRLHFTVGGYWYDDNATTTSEIAILGVKLPPPAPSFLPPVAVANNGFGNYVDATQSYAAYGQATFDITKKISIVGGLRYTSEKALASDNVNPVPGTDETFTDVSPMVGLNYQVTPDILVYFKDSRGFRAGGFSPSILTYSPFSPENATTYELGSRMQFLGGRLRVNPTVFLTNWNNIQFNSIEYFTVPPNPSPTPFPVIQNAGNAEIKGAEVEIQAAVTDNLLITASGSLLNGYYTSIAQSIASSLTTGSGLKRSPQSAYTIGGRYTLPLGNDRTLTLSANYAWQAHQRSATTDNDNVPIPSYGLLNTRLEFQPFGERFSISAFATNLTGTKYFEGGTNYASGGLIPSITADIGPPREYGLTGRINF